MSARLILYKPEINPDVYFENPPVSFWNFGTGWTFGPNNINGLGAEKLGVATSNLKLYNNDGYYNINDKILKPFTEYKYKIRAEFCINSGGGDYCRFIVGGVNIFTIPASLSSNIYEGTFTTGDSVDVLFTSTSGNSILLSYLNLFENPTSFEIDLTEGIDVALTYSIADVTDPDKRDASYSRSVRIPATKNNNIFFRHAYEITASGGFNPNKKIKSEIVDDGLQQFNGFAKLDNTERESNGLNNYSLIAYNLTLYGDLGDFFFTLGDTLINELDFSEYNHDYTKQNQFNSWYTEIVRSGSSYSNNTNGSFLTVTSSQNNSGRLQLNFSGSHNLVAGDWILIPENSITNITLSNSDPKYFYLGEHMVYSVVNSTSVVIQCPFYPAAGSITTAAIGTDRVRKHVKTGEGYVYPMIDYDQNNGSEYRVNQLYPAIYVWEIVQKIAKKAKYVIESSIIDSVMFKKLVMFNSNGALKLTPSEISNRLFKAKNTSDQFYTLNLDRFTNTNQFYYTGGPIPAIDIQINDDSTSPMFDNAGVFNTGTYRYSPNATGIYSIEVSAIGIFGFVPGGFSYIQSITNAIFQIDIYDYTLGTVVPNSPQVVSLSTLYADNTNNANFFINATIDNLQLTAGNNYGMRLYISSVGGHQFTGLGSTRTITYGVVGGFCYFGNKVVNTNVQEGDTVYLNSCLPKIKCSEFFMNIVRMFNLYITTDKLNDRKLFIETRDEFYENGVEKNWTDKLDTSQKLVQTPMSSLQGKIITYAYSDDSDFYNKDHKDKYGITYGNHQRKIDSDFKKNEYKIEISFAPTILVDNYGRIVSNAQSGSDTNGQNDPFSGKVRIGYFNCASSPYLSWLHKNSPSDSGTAHRLYPYAGHLDKPEAPYHDINFYYPRGVYFDYDSWTDRNLWNLYHKKQFLESTDVEGRLIEAYIHLTAKDIFELDFRDRYNIDGHILRLNKVLDVVISKNIPVKCEFIKALDIPPFTTEIGIGYDIGIGVGFVPEDFNYGTPKYIGQGNGSGQGQWSKVQINGNSKVGKYAYNVIVNGDDNNIGNGAYNIFVSGNGNNIGAGLNNISLINTDNVTITESGVSYLNGQNVTNIQAKILRIST